MLSLENISMYESKTVYEHLLTLSPKKSPTPESKQVRDAIIDVHPRHKTHMASERAAFGLGIKTQGSG